MIFKKNKKEIKICEKCGKELSEESIKKGETKCERCRGKEIKLLKRVLAVGGAVTTTTIAVVIFIATGGKKTRLK